ncbi:hypothetical protein PVAP13_4NG045260 [Panicum virgatum]|uniref:Uncharacterized protein n=1 Tax=Panicum virgatum TaxID=38727 RepID=A0A8T0T1B5_PANVG|nr:hypothetical protein PVAP13_4NG045260 [Panicum virgatum]
MANSARLRELGVSGFSSIFPNNSGTAVNKKNAKHRDNEDSGSEYDPSQDDTDQGDLIGDDNAKVGTKEKAPKQTSKERSNVFPGVRFRSRKRVFADQAPTRVTRSKSSITQPDTNLTPNGSTQHDDNTIAGDGVDCITHLDGHDQMTTEVRNHIPVFKHWKEYKKHPALFELFLGRLRAKFDNDTSNEVVINGCLEMMQSAVRQQRYKLKKDFFDYVPLHLVRKTSPVKVMSNEQWIELVDSWMTPQKMFHQTTGSCSYPVYVEKITQMENQLAAPTEDGQLKSATQVVGAVLHQNTKTNHFLRNVGIQVAKRRTTLQNVQAELEVEKRTNSEL